MDAEAAEVYWLYWNEQSGHTEGLENVKDYPQKSCKKPATTVKITQIWKNRRCDFPDFRG